MSEMLFYRTESPDMIMAYVYMPLNVPNHNKVIFTTECMKTLAKDAFIQSMLAHKTMYGNYKESLKHSKYIDILYGPHPKESHFRVDALNVIEDEKNGDKLEAKLIIDPSTSNGRYISHLLENGVKFHLEPDGVGKIEVGEDGKKHIKDFKLISVSIVGDHKAY